jgi:predicted transcriptional regulator
MAVHLKMNENKKNWTFLTNHSHVIYLIKQVESITVRDMAMRIGITERSVMAIISDLSSTDYIDISKKGRKNYYKVNEDKFLRHPLEMHCNIGSILDILQPEK